MLAGEPINGVTAQEALKYGIISTEVDPQFHNRIFIRMSKFLLRFFLKRTQVLEEVFMSPASLTRGEMTLDYAMPEGVELHDIFLTCRSYMHKTQEVVQLMSLLVTCVALMLVESPPPLTLASIRRTSTFMGRADRAGMELEWLVEAAKAVRDAGNAAYSSEGENKVTAKMKARYDEATKQAVKLVAPADVLGEKSTACLFASKTFPAFDAQGCLSLGIYLGQSKGTLDAFQPRRVEYARDAEVWLNKIVGEVKKSKRLGSLVSVSPVKRSGKGGGVLPDIKGLLLVELLVARPISDDCLGKMVKHLVHFNACVGVVGKEQLETALGPIFGGIAARCEEGE